MRGTATTMLTFFKPLAAGGRSGVHSPTLEVTGSGWGFHRKALQGREVNLTVKHKLEPVWTTEGKQDGRVSDGLCGRPEV